MSVLRRIIFIVLILFVFLVIFSFFLTSNLKIERKVTIESSPEIVFKQVNNLKNWKNWVVWAKSDPLSFNNEKFYSTPAEGVGSTFQWKSELDEIGEGTIKIVKSKSNELIEQEIKVRKSESLSYWYFNEKDNLVEVTWGMNLKFGFNPFTKWFGLFAEKDFAPDIERGLQNLKKYSEKLPKINSSIVSKKFLEQPQWFVAIREKVRGAEVENIHTKLFNEISLFLTKKSIETDLPPIVIYHFWSDTLVDVEAGLLVKDSIFINDERIKLKKIKPENVVTATHFGAYDRIPETYFSINEWMRKNQVKVIGPPWEIYVVDPSVEQNPNKWVTEIYFPIQ